MVLQTRVLPVVEALERRALLAHSAVTTLADSGPGSLRQAVLDAATGDTIDVGGMNGTVTLLSTITLNKSLSIVGDNADEFVISGGNVLRPFLQSAGQTTLAHLTIVGGNAGGSDGGAYVINSGAVTFDHVALTGNLASRGGALNVKAAATATLIDSRVNANTANGDGGGIYTFGDLHLLRTTVSDNTALSIGGGGIGVYFAPATRSYEVSIIDSTIAGNTAKPADGGYAVGAGVRGIVASNAPGGDLGIATFRLVGSTVAHNQFVDSTNRNGGGLHLSQFDALIFSNAIVADNTGGGVYDDVSHFNLQGTPAVDHTLVGRANVVPGFVNGVAGNLIGSRPAPRAALLGTLGDHGGPTPTVPLLAGSPAIGAAAVITGSNADQRGVSRVGVPDIGSYEFGYTAPTFMTTALPEAAAGVAYAATVEVNGAVGMALTLTATGLPTWATFTDHDNGTATISGTPGLDDIASTTVTLSVHDAISDVSVDLALDVPNRAPTLLNALPAPEIGRPYAATLHAVDPDGQPLAFEVAGMPAWMKVADNGDGTLTFGGTPGIGDAASSTLHITLDDGYGNVDADVVLNVTFPEVSLADGLLLINGTDADDDLQVTRVLDDVQVIRNGTVHLFATDAVNAIRINGFDGDDQLRVDFDELPTSLLGGAGHDTIVGGAGDDHVWAGVGDDIVDLGGGSNHAWGGAGDDMLRGGVGRDYLRGEDGDDQLFGLEGDDQLRGGAGADTLDAGSGRNQLWGDAGDDRLIGGNSPDILRGQAGNDQLFGRGGRDRLFVGTDDDTAYDAADDIFADDVEFSA